MELSGDVVLVYILGRMFVGVWMVIWKVYDLLGFSFLLVSFKLEVFVIVELVLYGLVGSGFEMMVLLRNVFRLFVKLILVVL